MAHVLLAVRRERLSPALVGLFRLIEATESVFSSGMLTEDVILKDALFQDNYSEQQTENLLIIVGSSGKITYANNLFYIVFNTSDKEVINYSLEEVVPELGYALEGLRDRVSLPSPRQVRFSALGTADYFVTCTHTNQKIPRNGLAITIQKVMTPTQSNAKAFLGVASLNAVDSLTWEDGAILARRGGDNHKETFRLSGPAVISVTSDICRSHIPSMKDILAAGKKPVEIWDAVELSGQAAVSQTLSVLAPERTERSQVVFRAGDEGGIEAFAKAIKKYL